VGEFILVLAFININISNQLSDYLEKNNQYLHSSFVEGTGENINVTLRQSLLNTTTKQFSNLDNDNTFLPLS